MQANRDFEVVVVEGLGMWRGKRLGRLGEEVVVVVAERSWSFIAGSIIFLLLLSLLESEATRFRAFDRRIKVGEERESCENWRWLDGGRRGSWRRRSEFGPERGE